MTQPPMIKPKKTTKATARKPAQKRARSAEADTTTARSAETRTTSRSAEAAESAPAGRSAQTAESAPATQATQAGQAEQPTESAQAMQPMRSAQPDDSAQPAQAAQPMQPRQPAQSEQPPQPSHPANPAPPPKVLIDADRWPDLARTPDHPVRARIARRLFTHALKDVPVTVVAPNGLALAGAGVPGGGSPVLRIRRPHEFLNRLGADGLIGFGEAYQTGAWDTASGDELAALLTELARRLENLVPKPLQRLRALQMQHMPREQHGDRDGARNNAHAHYDLSNEMFELFLDPSMTYSSALFDPVADADGPGDLHAAQLRKIDAILDAAGVRKGTRLLEIGSGWGALAIKAAGERGATVLSLTLSEEQQELARRRVAAAGLADRIEVRLADYREVADEPPFDAVVSVEMIEAVGRRFLPDYFQAIERALAPGGRVVIQAITMAHHRMLATQDSYSWIHKYVFPGGLIPSVTETDYAAGTAGLSPVARRDFGPDYARTLRAWRHRFEENWPEIAALGFDEVFRRTWRFYLAYCEAGFASGYLGVSQLTYTRR